MIVGLGGKARSGKDTAGQILVESHGFVRFGFADRLKAVAYDSNPMIGLLSGRSSVPFQAVVDAKGWERAKRYPVVREYLQQLGVAVREHLGENVWAEPVVTAAWHESITHGRAVITDVRFPNEFNSIKAAGGVLVRLDRPGAGLDGGAGAHASETALDDADWDRVVSNHGTLEDLEAKLVKALDL